MSLFIAFTFAAFGNPYAAAFFIGLHWLLDYMRQRGIVL